MSRRLVGVVMALSLLVTGFLWSPPTAQANTAYDTNFVCANSYDPNWWCLPVAHIRVKRMSMPGQPVETHTLLEWMQNSLPLEINCADTSYHQQVIDATAVALKMFGWARHLARGHQSPSIDQPVTWVNYDVTDDESDGLLYQEGKATTACNDAINRTNGIMVVRGYSGAGHGTIFETGWRSGAYTNVTSGMAASDIYRQNNAEYEIDHGTPWSTLDNILSYFYASYHKQNY